MRLIRKIDRYIPKRVLLLDLYLFQEVTDMSIISNLGFSIPITDNELIIPNPNLNRAANINSNGKILVRKDLPKVPYWIHYELDLPNFGDYSKGTHHVSFSVEKKKYLREYTIPFSIPLIIRIINGKTYVCSENVN